MRFRLSIRVQFYLLMMAGFFGATIASFAPILLAPFGLILALQPASHFIKHPRMSLFYRTGVRETLLLVLSYLLLSLAWGMEAKTAFLAWLALFAVFVGGCLLFESVRQFNHRQKQALADAFISGIAIAVILVGVNFFIGKALEFQLLASAVPMSGVLEYGSYYLSLIIWPCLAYFLMKGRTAMALVLALTLAMILMKMDHSPAIIALIVGSVFMALSFYFPRLSVAIFVVAWTALIVAIPLYSVQMDADKVIETHQESVSPEIEKRLHVWELSATHALAQDPNGSGFNSAGNVKLGKKETLPFDDQLRTLPLPANSIIQLWLELGLIGLFGVWLLVLVVFLSFRNMVSSSSFCKMAATAQCAAMLVLPLCFENIWNVPFLVIAVFSLLGLHICVNAAARNVI